MYLVLRDSRELAEMSERDGDIGGLSRLRRVLGELAGCLQHRADLGQGAERLVRPFRQIEAFFVSEQPLDEAFKFLPTQQRELPHPFTCGGNLNARQAE